MRRQTILLLVITHGFVFLLGAGLQEAELSMPQTISGERTTTAKIATVSNTGEGSVGEVHVSITDGSGRVLLDTDPFIDLDTQASGRIAKAVAEEYTGVTLDDKNVNIRFDIDAAQLGGPSAGAAITLALIAAIQNKTVDDDAVITGTIQPDGRLGRVGGILEKALAAGSSGMEYFVVPDGQSKITYYTLKDTARPGPLGGYSPADYQIEQIDIGALTQQQGAETREAELIGDTTFLLEDRA